MFYCSPVRKFRVAPGEEGEEHGEPEELPVAFAADEQKHQCDDPCGPEAFPEGGLHYDYPQ